MISAPSESLPESSAYGEARWSSCEVENPLLPWLLSYPAVQKPLPVRTLSAPSVPLPVRAWHGADGVALVEAEMGRRKR
jgi:hypothetical protein